MHDFLNIVRNTGITGLEIKRDPLVRTEHISFLIGSCDT